MLRAAEANRIEQEANVTREALEIGTGSPTATHGRACHLGLCRLPAFHVLLGMVGDPVLRRRLAARHGVVMTDGSWRRLAARHGAGVSATRAAE